MIRNARLYWPCSPSATAFFRYSLQCFRHFFDTAARHVLPLWLASEHQPVVFATVIFQAQAVMYRIPQDLDLSGIVGEFTTQVLVGQFDIQFRFGKYHFAIQSDIHLIRHGEVIGIWQSGAWPPQQFFEVMNVNVVAGQMLDEREVVIHLENGIEIHLRDDSDKFECMQIYVDGEQSPYII
ncbi:hypothetical protein [Comamonas sp.]|uniref:hypothetical protein n=1 Tax=Comamonas sp. TaxID=34028 RepID=UPI002647AFD6|nr:hypothetical protein [Comamonas sp.]MDN5536593.1 hypothetical protein [Comamonas sp.]